MRLFPFLLLGGALLAHLGQKTADEARADTELETLLMFQPQSSRMRVVSMSYRTLVADVLWLRTVLTFGTYMTRAPTPEWREWLGGMVLTAAELDPSWRTLYTYGGLMLKVVEAYELSTEVFLKGSEVLPDDHFLLFSAGMNQFLYMDDPQGAYELLKKASEKPKAPEWYKGAARAFLVKKAQPGIAIRFLEEEIAATTDPALKESLERHLANVRYERRTGQLEEVRSAVETRLGRRIASLGELVVVGGLDGLPEDPLGGHWMIDDDERIRSSVAAARAAEQDLRYERGLLMHMGR